MKETADITDIRSGNRFGAATHFNFQNRSAFYFSLAIGWGFTSIKSYEYHSQVLDLSSQSNEWDLLYNYFGFIPSLQVKLPISKTLSWRAGAGMGTYAEAANFVEMWQINPTVELYTGIMMGPVVSLGVNFTKPLNGYTTFDYDEFNGWGNVYGINAITVDLKLCLGPHHLKGNLPAPPRPPRPSLPFGKRKTM